MDTLMLALIATCLLIVVVMIIYLTDRVNSLEKQTHEAVQSMQDKPAAPKGAFAGLASKKLWDAMTGQVPEGMEEDAIGEVRERYQAVLRKHVEGLFSEGLKDGQRGLSGDPKNTRWISTLRGQVESWLPQTQVNAIYKAGVDIANAQTPDQQLAIKTVLHDTCLNLYSKTQIDLPSGLLDELLPPVSVSIGAETGQGAQPVTDKPA